MNVNSTGIKNDIINDKYGKRGKCNSFGMPTYSIPLNFSNYPQETKSFAIVLEDKDAFPISGGFSWIHWVACNIIKDNLLENESKTNTDIIQGVNSWISMQGGENDYKECSFYGGMAPPDKPHLYEIHVYALDIILELENGFLFNNLYKKMDKHILDTYTLKATYNN